jgi:hypothetical protein
MTDAPTGAVVLDVGPAYVQIGWNPVTDADSYDVALDDLVPIDTVGELTWIFSALDANTEYTFNVRAVDLGVPSDWVEITAHTALAVGSYAGCEWPLDPACLGTEWDTLTDAVKERSAALASSTLRRLTGYRVGGCPIVVRPCKAGCADGFVPFYDAYSGGSFRPGINASGFWINSCGCDSDCSCTTLCEVNLPGPVGAVYEIKIDGVVVPTSDYFVSGTKIVWAGADDCPWPTCQDLTLPDTDAGTFSIRYLNSYAVDGLGAYAAATLAMEYAKACTGNKCRLPAGVTSVTRQGVSYEIASGAFPDGFTGIREIDAYISLWNPGAMRQASKVYTPDRKAPHRRVY